MERWIGDSPDQAGAAFEEFLRAFYRDNALVRGGLVLGGRTVDLTAVRMPVLNVYATRDHLVPPASSLALGALLRSRAYRPVAFEGGHIGVYVSARAQDEVSALLDGFLRARSP
jgi:polyhydroxyalkanoate synthase